MQNIFRPLQTLSHLSGVNRSFHLSSISSRLCYIMVVPLAYYDILIGNTDKFSGSCKASKLKVKVCEQKLYTEPVLLKFMSRDGSRKYYAFLSFFIKLYVNIFYVVCVIIFLIQIAEWVQHEKCLMCGIYSDFLPNFPGKEKNI